jgi:hypothetical protein
MKKSIFYLCLIILLLSCQTTKNTLQREVLPSAIGEEPLTTEVLQFPLLANTSKMAFELTSLVNGIITEISEDELGMQKIIIETDISYYFKQEERSLTYYFVFGGLEAVLVSEGMEISAGDPLGTASSESYITAYSQAMDNFLIRMTNSIPVQYQGMWYFSPNWVIQGYTAWMSFRPVDDFKEALLDFYSRWAVEGNEARGSTIHYFPNLDRIRAKIQLAAYPEIAKRDMTIKLVEDTYYNGKEIFVLETRIEEEIIDGHKVVIYWQADFDKYLKEEYDLLDNLYLYASIYAIDHEEKEIIVCVRDFAQTSDEDIIKERVSGLSE